MDRIARPKGTGWRPSAGAIEDPTSQDPFYACEDLKLIGQPLRQSFPMQFDVPTRDPRLIGRHDDVDLGAGHAQIEESPDNIRKLTPGPVGRSRNRRVVVRMRT